MTSKRLSSRGMSSAMQTTVRRGSDNPPRRVSPPGLGCIRTGVNWPANPIVCAVRAATTVLCVGRSRRPTGHTTGPPHRPVRLAREFAASGLPESATRPRSRAKRADRPPRASFLRPSDHPAARHTNRSATLCDNYLQISAPPPCQTSDGPSPSQCEHRSTEREPPSRDRQPPLRARQRRSRRHRRH